MSTRIKDYERVIITLISIIIFLISNAQEGTNPLNKDWVNLYNQSQDCLSQGKYEDAIALKAQIYNKLKDGDLKGIGGLCAFELSQIYSMVFQDLNKYIYWLDKADKCDFSSASGLLGDAYLTGKEGVPQDYIKAKFYYEKSDEGRCKWILATMYSENGEFGKNDSEFLKYVKQAVDRNDPDAEFILGLYYFYGKIVKKDSSLGTSLIKKAAEQNHIKAIRFLQERNIK